jgi:CDP-diacylglycerol--glycerol-3-phosphate 3-phosphatidyltransferase
MSSPEHPDTPATKPTLTDRLRKLTVPIVEPVVNVLDRLGVSPDMITFFGMLTHILLAWLVATGRFQWAGVAMILIAPLDAFDGALARKQGRAPGGFGAFWDSTLDRIAEVILFAGFVYYFTIISDPWLVLAAYAALTGSLLVSYSRGRAEGLGFDCKVGIFSRVERYVVLIVGLLLNLPDILIIILAIGTYFTVLQRIWHVYKQARDQGRA